MDDQNSLNRILSRTNYERSHTSTSSPASLLDPALDLAWGQTRGTARAPHTYFDYVFTGQDVIAYIEGSTDPQKECIPIIELGFNIEQQKVPVYGFWDYTFSSVMRGTRMISGVISIATVSTSYMTDMIKRAAEARVAKWTTNPIRGLDRDETKIREYWSRNIDTSASFNEGGRTIFSAHPPFNLIIDFNMQSVSVNESPFAIADELYEKYNGGPANIQNYNERLVDTDMDDTMHYILENVELTSMETQFTPAGDVAAETYSFFARDLRTPRVSQE